MNREDKLTPQEIARALRCTSTPNGDCMGETCPFYAEEEVPEEMQRELGRIEWPSCDVDAIGMAGAQMIEQLAHEVERRDRLLCTLGVKIGKEGPNE